MTKGFVCLHRSIFSSPHFKKEPYCEIAAFSWMIAQASHKTTSVRYKDHIFNLERGQFACSVRDMAEKFSWHRSKVDRFLNRLVKDGVIKTETGPRHLANKLTICNYDEYQNVRDIEKTQPETHPRHLRDTSETENNHLTTEPLNQKPDSKELSIDHFFETEFWPAYPKKVGKGDALKAIKAAAKRSSTGEIIVGLRRACDHWRSVGTEPQFIPNPGTWLRADRWKDEQPACGPPMRPPQEKLGRAERVAIAMAERERRKQENEQRGFNL